MYRCELCGQFLKHIEDFYSWAPFGSTGDMEPPEPVFAHVKCWNSQDPEERDRAYEYSWQKPDLYEMGDYDVVESI